MALTMLEKRHVGKEVALRYLHARKKEKGIMLQEFCATTGYSPPYAAYLLRSLARRVILGELACTSSTIMAPQRHLLPLFTEVTVSNNSLSTRACVGSQDGLFAPISTNRPSRAPEGAFLLAFSPPVQSHAPSAKTTGLYIRGFPSLPLDPSDCEVSGAFHPS
jgi:hypothetical protein